MESSLKSYFLAHRGRRIHKWLPYFEIYERHLSRFRNTDVHLLEIGVSHGGSLQMWRDYFGADACIVGADVKPRCKRLEKDGFQILIGDQADRDFLRSIATELPRLDVLIDDGGHTMKQQMHTFEELFPHISHDGVYLVEDLHTSYFSDCGGGLRRPGTFIEYSKNLVDQLSAWHSKGADGLEVDAFTRSAHSMHFYDSMLVIEKRRMEPPTHRKIGKKSF